MPEQIYVYYGEACGNLRSYHGSIEECIPFEISFAIIHIAGFRHCTLILYCGDDPYPGSLFTKLLEESFSAGPSLVTTSVPDMYDAGGKT